MDEKTPSGRRRPRPVPGGKVRPVVPVVENLESRDLFSSAPVTPGTVAPAVVVQPAATGYTNPSGYTPAQIAAAYGFNQVNFQTKTGSVAGNGAGQTIAIVDAYNDPNIASDLATFDARYLPNSAPVSSFLSVVNQTGGSKLPATDADWAGEIALDVEWAHAAAPGAKILLVEANTDGLGDLMASVNYARHAADVSVVSMSWGGGEFYGQTAYDSTFTTPAGHPGVTFVAASGDAGPFYGAEWPASSPNVISVGGTSLTVQSSGGAYGSETAWSGSTGGVSQIESVPAYQSHLPTSATHSTVYTRFGAYSLSGRSAPDVSFNADPRTGFSVYDSLPDHDQGYAGWQEVGGTSAGAPQWAALVAIADQGRALAGRGTLDGATQTLPALYGLHANAGTAAYTAYTTDFHDVTGGAYYNPASSGYDHATGLGSPHVSQTVLVLTNAGASTTPPPTATASPAATSPSASAKQKSTTVSPHAIRNSDSQNTPSALPQAASAASASTTTAGETRADTAPAPGRAVAALIEGGPVGSSLLVGAAGAAALIGPAPSGRADLSFPLLGLGAAGVAPAVNGTSAAAAGSSGLAAVGAALTPEALTSALRTGLSELSSLVSPLPAAEDALGSAIATAPACTGTLLGLAPALWTGVEAAGYGWEICAAASLGAALAGYFYSAAVTKEDHRRGRRADVPRPGARRIAGGWELLPTGEWESSDFHLGRA